MCVLLRVVVRSAAKLTNSHRASHRFVRCTCTLSSNGRWYKTVRTSKKGSIA